MMESDLVQVSLPSCLIPPKFECLGRYGTGVEPGKAPAVI